MLPYKLITFDATGTLIFFATPVLEKYLETGLKFGIKPDLNILQSNAKEAWQSLNQEHPNYGRNTGLGWQNWWTAFVEKTFAGYIKTEDKSKVTAIAEELIDFYSTKNGYTVGQGTVDLLNYLQTESVQLGVISNYDPRLHKILDCLELKKYFNFILTSYEFGYAKPESKIFKEAMRLGKCQVTSDVLHVGDNLELDYIGAKEAGLNAILIGGTTAQERVSKSEHFENFYALKAHLQSVKSANFNTV